jgi:putative transposase
VSRYRFIEVEKVNHAVRTLCRVLQVSRAGYYHWGHQPLSERAQADIQLTERIATIHTRSRQTYGAPRVRAELRNMGHGHSRKRVARLMRLAGLAGRYPKRFRRTTISDPLTSIPDLVQRDFAPSAPNQLWVGDITYIRTWEGWLYLAVLLDCYSRRVVGWSMADHLRTELPLSALQMALARRGPAPQLIHHTDRGSQGGFNRPSQRFDGRSCDGKAQAAPVRSGVSPADVVAWPTPGGTAGGSAAVLGGDRTWPRKRGRRCRGWRLAGGRGALVPREWRHANNPSDPAIGALPVVRRA